MSTLVLELRQGDLMVVNGAPIRFRNRARIELTAKADECYQALKLVRRVMRHEEVVLGIAPATGGVTED